MKTHLLSLFCTLFLLHSSCKKANLIKEVRPIVEAEIVPISPQELPPEFVRTFEENDVVFFGETHYKQEHQDFIVSLLPFLSEKGYTIILDEGMQAFNWMLEDYLNGNRDSLPSTPLFFKETLIEGIKAHNQTVEDSQKIQLQNFDVNHWNDVYKKSVAAIEEELGELWFFDGIDRSRETSFYYKDWIQHLMYSFNGDSEFFRDTLGDIWYKRIRALSENELESFDFRNSKKNEIREEMMFENIKRIKAKNPGVKILINTGLNHAQLITHMDEDIERVAQKVKRSIFKTASISFLSLEGEYRTAFDSSTKTFDLAEESSKHNLIHTIIETGGYQQNYLSLQDPIFTEDSFPIIFSPGGEFDAIPIGEVFDALIILPKVTVLESMEKYHWEW